VCLGIVGLAVLVMAVVNLSRAFSLAGFLWWLNAGAGVYWLMIVGAAIGVDV
jgi:hypothetical protein